jgi:2-oxo-4-hydroxy-4-carboxy-5-ureidoimidazoline decarboxylase
MDAANENRRLRPSAMDREAFVAAFGGVFEHSPWIAEEVYARGLTDALDDIAGLHNAFMEAIEEAGHDRQLALLRAHPDLAGRLAVRGELTEASTSEQASAGLDRCTPEEFAEFQRLNDAYKEKFGFPFIVAVRGMTREAILDAFRKRVDHEAEWEFQEALRQVGRIALLRLEALFAQT